MSANLAAAKHLAYSERVVSPLAAAAHEELLEVAPWLGHEPSSRRSTTWRTRARRALVRLWLDANGPLDDAGNPRPALDLKRKLERLVNDKRARLGLDPAAAAKLSRNLAGAARDADLAAPAAEGRRIREARSQ